MSRSRWEHLLRPKWICTWMGKTTRYCCTGQESCDIYILSVVLFCACVCKLLYISLGNFSAQIWEESRSENYFWYFDFNAVFYGSISTKEAFKILAFSKGGRGGWLNGSVTFGFEFKVTIWPQKVTLQKRTFSVIIFPKRNIHPKIWYFMPLV